MRRESRVWKFVFPVLLTVFTMYVLLSTFVITQVYGEASDNSDNMKYASLDTEGTGDDISESSSGRSEENTVSDPGDTGTGTGSGSTVIGTAEGDGYTVTVTSCEIEDTVGYNANVTVNSIERLRTAFANGSYGKNVTETTSEMASDNGAVLAVNGDYYGARESGYVIRNGVLYRDSSAGDQEDPVIYSDGTFEVINEQDVTAQELLDKGAWQVLSFGPGLVEDGTVTVSENDEVAKAKTSNPRTAIGIIDEGHYVLVVADGRTDESEGLSLKELADYMESLGCTEAYNLDGGGSSTMVFQGSVINKPTTGGRQISERAVSDIVYIG